MSSFNAPAYSAALGLAGMGFSSWASRRARGARPVPVLPMSKSADQQAQLIQLRRLVARNTPQVSNWGYFTAIATTATAGTQQFDIKITELFTASADFDAQVIGDRFLNHALYFSVNMPTDVPKVRIVIYWAKKALNVFQPNTAPFTEEPDPAAFTVISDRCYFPTLQTTVSRVKVNLRKLMTIYNKSSDVLEKGDLKIRVIIENPTAAARSFPTSSRLYLSNK